jgi:hypothetical protein
MLALVAAGALGFAAVGTLFARVVTHSRDVC